LARWADRTTKKWWTFPSPGRCPDFVKEALLVLYTV
jgi:hypothetical protein